MAEQRYVFVATGLDQTLAAFRSIDQAAERSGRSVEQSHAKGERAAKKHADIERMSAEQARAELDKIHKKEADEYEKSLRKELDALEKTTKRKIALAHQEARERERSMRQLERASRAAEEEAQKSFSRRSNLGAGIGGFISGGLGRAADAGKNMLVGGVRESLELDDVARRISINARKSGEGFIPHTELRKQFEQVAANTPGVSSMDVADAAQKYISLTGDVATARQNMQTFATVASATGAKIGEVAETAASLGEKFNVKSVGEMQESLALLTFQGKEGAFELKDMAAQFQRLAAAAQAGGLGKGIEGVKTLGGFLQIARGGTGSGRMAATAAENVLASFSKAGVDVKKIGFNAAVAQEISKRGGTDVNPAKMKALLKEFRQQGIRGINPLVDVYGSTFETKRKEGATAKQAQEAGRLAVIAKLEEAGAAAASWKEIQKDAAFAQQSASAQITAAWEQIKSALADSLVPAINSGIVPAIVNAIPPMVSALGQLATSADRAARALGLYSGPAEGDTQDKLRKEASETSSPEKAASLNAQADVAALRQSTKTGQKEVLDKQRGKFLDSFVTQGEGPLDWLRGRAAAWGVEHSGDKGMFGKLARDTVDFVANDKGGAAWGPLSTGGANARQKALLAEYQKDFAQSGIGLRVGPDEKAANGALTAEKVAPLAEAISRLVDASMKLSASGDKLNAAGDKLGAANGGAGGSITPGD